MLQPLFTVYDRALLLGYFGERFSVFVSFEKYGFLLIC